VANITVDLLGITEGIASTRTTQVYLEPGQVVRWSNAVAKLFGRNQPGAGGVAVLRIDGDVPLRVTASSQCTACRTTSSVPVLDRVFALDEGDVPGDTLSNNPAWQSGVMLVNSNSGWTLVTLALHRGDQVIEESIFHVPRRGVRKLRMERIFRTQLAPDDFITFRSERRVLVLGTDMNESTGARVFTPARPDGTFRRRRAVRFTSSVPAPVPQTIVLTPKKDNTLYESATGGLSNGAGVHLFSGATGSSSLRRALLAFDVAAQIPPGSRITRATLTLRISQTLAGAQEMKLHRVVADWGEGTSNAGSSRDGTGASSRTGDATWIHRFFPDQRWTAAGGDFESVADATASVGFGSGTWDSSAATIARVQEWLDQPSTNFGWIVIGNELTSVTAKRFDSREITSETTRPALTIEFER
jgi:hypothetical protein